MNICEGIDTDVEYYWKRTDGWTWNGRERWWEVFVVFLGFNGSMGAWVSERWRWNGSAETIREHTRTLSYEDTQKLIDEVKSHRSAEVIE